MELSYRVTLEDVRSLRFRVDPPNFGLKMAVGAFFVILGLLFFLNSIMSEGELFSTKMIVLLASLLAILAILKSMRYSGYSGILTKTWITKSPYADQITDVTLTITDEGLVESTASTRRLIKWTAVREVYHSGGRYFIRFNTKQGIVINPRHVQAGDAFSFIAEVHSRLANR